MQPIEQHIVYFGGVMAVSSATHKKINKEKVYFRKLVIYLRLWKVEGTKHR